MRGQNFLIFIYSSLAIVALTLVWGFREIPRRGEIAERQVRESLEHEIGVIRGAVRAAVDATRLRTLEVLRGEPEQNQRALIQSPLLAAALVEPGDGQWKTLSFVTKAAGDVAADTLKRWVDGWPLATLAPDESYVTKVGEFGGRAAFAVATKVHRVDGSTAFAVGVVPAAEFPLELATDHARDVSVFDGKGAALALNHSAYVGANLRRQPIVSEILESDVVNLRTERLNERRQPVLGAAARMPFANLYAAIEAPVPNGGVTNAWLTLALAAIGAIALNWVLFGAFSRPLLRQLAQAEAQVENLRRLLSEAPATAPAAPAPEAALDAAELPSLDFVGTDSEAVAAPPAPGVSLTRVVNLALRSLDDRVKSLGVTLDRVGLEEVEVTHDALALQTALEEILKNALEALAESRVRRVTLSAHALDGRVHLSVEDSGPGVAKDLVARIFEPFYSTRSSAGGSARGLGLNVVRRVIEEIGGSVVGRNCADHPGFVIELCWPVDARPAVAKVDPQDLALIADEDDDFVPSTPRDLIRRPKVRSPG